LSISNFIRVFIHVMTVGWGYKDVLDRLEEKWNIEAQAFHG